MSFTTTERKTGCPECDAATIWQMGSAFWGIKARGTSISSHRSAEEAVAKYHAFHQIERRKTDRRRPTPSEGQTR